MSQNLFFALLTCFMVPAFSAHAGDSISDRVKVAAVQFHSAWGKPANNRKRLAVLIEEAAKNGAKIVVLPETAITGYMPDDLKQTWQIDDRKLSEGLDGVSPADVAESVPGESTREFGELAKKLKIYLTVPFIEIDRKSEELFNSIVLVGPTGERLLHYRKLNPWPWAEKGWATKGDRGHQYVDTPYGRLGLLICFDINFEPPTLKRKKVDHLLYCIAWVDQEKSTWFRKELPDIARNADLNIIGANWSLEAPTADEKPPTWHGFGKSLVIARDGNVLSRARSDFGNEILYAELPIPRQ